MKLLHRYIDYKHGNGRMTFIPGRGWGSLACIQLDSCWGCCSLHNTSKGCYRKLNRFYFCNYYLYSLIHIFKYLHCLNRFYSPIFTREVHKIKLLLPLAYLLFLRSNNYPKNLKLQLNLENAAPATPIFFTYF